VDAARSRSNGRRGLVGYGAGVLVRGDLPDPTELYRIRDGVYAADLLIAAVAEFDLFSWLAMAGPVRSPQLRAALGIAERPCC
jgi:hypothetical protein